MCARWTDNTEWFDRYSEAIERILAVDRFDGQEGLYFRAAQAAALLLEAKHAVVVLPVDESRLRVAGCYGYPTLPLAGDLSAERGVIGRCFRERKWRLVGDVTRDPDYVPFDETVRSELAVPVFDKSWRDVQAVINVESTNPTHFDLDDRDVLQRLGQFMLLSSAALKRIDNLRRKGKEESEDFRALAWLLQRLPDEVMVIDSRFRPIWANEAKRNAIGGLNCVLPDRPTAARELARLIRGKEWPKPDLLETCYWNIERRPARCPLCVCNRAMESRQAAQGVVYQPAKLDCIVELSATPLIRETETGDGGNVLGSVEIARRVTMREKVLELAPTLWRDQTEAEALEATAEVLHERVGYRRVRLYASEDDARRLRGITLGGPHQGLATEAFRKKERVVPEELAAVFRQASKAALIVPSDDVTTVQWEQSYGHLQARVPRTMVREALDPEGDLRLDSVAQVVALTVEFEQDRFLLCIDGLDLTAGRPYCRAFTSDDLQALTIYGRLASAALESVRQKEVVSKLAILGEVAACWPHHGLRSMEVLSSKAITHSLAALVNSLLGYLRSRNHAEPWDSLARAVIERMTDDTPIPVHGEVADLVRRVTEGLRDRGVTNVQDATVSKVVRILHGNTPCASPSDPNGMSSPSKAPLPDDAVVSWLASLNSGFGEPWQMIGDLVEFVVAIKDHASQTAHLGLFAQAVKEVFPRGGPETEDKSVVDLDNLALQAANAIEKLSQEKYGVTAECQLHGRQHADEPVLANVKPGQVLLAWLSLLDNAVYAARKGNPPHVVICTRRTNGTVEVTIENNGEIVPHDLRPRFGRQRVSSKGGMGIGYMLAAGLIRANDGKIEFAPDDERMITRFHMRFRLSIS